MMSLGSCNVLARELITTIHHLCCDFVEQRSEQTHSESPEVVEVSGVGIEPEDGRMAALTSYLLQGRGSLLLSSLDALPDKEITCREDLLNLLLSLLPLLWKIPVEEASSHDFILPSLNESLFVAATNRPSPLSSHLPGGLARKAGLLPLSLGQSYHAPGRRARRQRKGAIGPGITKKNSTDSELSSGECPLPIMSTCWKRPTCPPPLAVAWTLTSEDFSPPKSSQGLLEEEGSVELGTWNVSDSDTCQPFIERIHSPVCELDKVNANEPLNSSGSPFELCRVLLSLLNKMCSSCYLVHSGQRGQALTVGIIPSLLRFLGALGEETGGAFAAGWTGESVSLIQRMLLRCILRILVATVGSSLSDHDESNMEVLQTAASDLLKAAKTTQLELKRVNRLPASPFSPKPKCTEEEALQTKQVEIDTGTRVAATGHHEAFLGPELLHGTLQITLSAVCASGSNPFFLSQTMEFLREFVSGHGFKLYHEALLSLEKLLPFGQTLPQVCQTPVLRDARFYIRVLIADVTAIIVAVKKSRINRACPSPLYGANAHRKRHHHRLRQSTSPVHEHHHSDLSGQPAFSCGLQSNHSPNPFDLESFNSNRILLGVGEDYDDDDDADDAVSREHCCVALFAARCLSVASMATSLEVAGRVLVAVHKAGVCCCLDPREVVRPVFQCICGPVGASGGRAFQQYALAVLAHLMLDQLGGHASGLETETKLHVGQQCTFCSEYASSSSDLQDVEQVRRRWEILENYTGLVLGDAGPLTALLVVRHASYLARNGCGELRRQVFVHVMAPLLRHGAEAACQLVPIPSEDQCICAQTSGFLQRISTPGLLCSCLDTLRVLLHDSSLLDLLLASNGLSQLVNLLSMEAVRPVLLVLFQALLLILEKQPQPGAEQDGNHCSDVPDVCPPMPHHTQPAECDLATRRRHIRIGCQQPGRQKPYFERKWWRSDQHHAAVDCFLKVAVGSITVKRSCDYKTTVTPDSEDTSGYDSTAASQGCDLYNCSALMSPIDVALPSCETSMRFASDLWGTSSRLSRTSAAFCCHSLQSGAFHICRRALSLAMASFWRLPPRMASKPCDVDARTLLKSLHEQHISTASSDLSSTECLLSDKPISPTSPSELAVDLMTSELDSCSRCESTRNDQRPMTNETPEAFVDTRCCSVKRSPTPSDVVRSSVGVAGGFVCETAKSEGFTLATVNLLQNLLAICLQSSVVAFHQDTAIEQVSQGTQPVCSVPELLKDVQRQLTESHVLSTSIAWPLYEALLAVAFPEDLTNHDWWGGNYREDDEADLALLQEWDKKWHDDVDEDDAPIEVIGKKSSLTQSCDGGEEGYEADSESNPEETPADVSKEETYPRINALSSPALGMTGAGAVSCGVNTGRQHVLLFPEVCGLVVQLLVTGTTSPDLNVVCKALQAVHNIAKSREENVASLNEQGIVKTLLTGFGKFLSQEDPQLNELQVVLVDLLVTLAAVQISPEELTLLLKLFTVKSPPTELLLDALLHVVQANMEPVPSQFLTFPLLLIQPSSSMGGAPLPTAWTQKVKGRTASRMLHVFQDISGLHANKKPDQEIAVQGPHSVWSLASLQLPLPASQACWPHHVASQAAGFSVALWLRLEPVEEVEGCLGSSMERRRKPMKNRLVVFRDSSIESTEGERVVVIDYPLPVRSGDRLPISCSVHLISIGSRCLMLQVWAEPAYGLLVFRVVVDPGDGRKADLLAQAESREGVLAPSQWHHMALSYRQRNEGKRNAHGRLAVWIDGRRNSEVALDFATQLSRKAGLPSDKLKTCFVGHSVASQEDVDHFGCSWSLGNLLVFNDAVLDSLSAFHLYSCGPDLRSVLPCKLGVPPPLYTRYADLDILRTGQLQDLLIRGQGLNLSSLRASVCLAYSPGVPATYTTYEYPSPGRGQRRSSSYRQPPIPRDVSLVAGKSVLVSLYPRVHQGLQASLYNVGCIGAFIFLFARVVELCASEEAQACALQSVLSLAKRHQRRWNELTADRGHAMLFQVLGKPRAFVGFHVLKVLLDAACDCSVLSWNPERSCFELYPETHAVIQDVELLGSMLSAWRVWARAQAGVWETLMAAMEILIRETHPAQMFNVKQLLRARLVEQLLLTCLLLQENEHEDPISLPPAVSRALVRLVEELIGSPPDSELLASVCSFLLAAHSPASTYVCHTSAAFYFSLHTDGRVVEEKLCAINALRKQSSPQATAPHTPDSSCSFAFESPKVPLFPSSSNAAEMTKGKSPKGSPPSPVQPSSDIPKLRRQVAIRQHDSSLDDLRELPEVEAECGNLPVVGYDDSRQDHQSSDGDSASSQTLCDEVDITIDCHRTTGVEEPSGPVDLKHLVCDGSETGDKPTTTSHNADESKVDDVFQGFIRKDHQPFDTGTLDGAWGEHGLIGGQSSFESADTISSRSESLHRSLEDGDTQSSSRLEAGTGCARMLQRVLSRNWDLGLAFPSVSHGTFNCPKSPLERSSDEEWTTGFFPGSSVDSDTTMATEPLCNSQTEDGLLLIFCGLYRLLHTMLLLLPDSMLPAFTDGLLTPEMLIVLCNHPSPDARLSVVKVLDAHFQRATDEQKTAFVRGHGFYLLANQLHQHVASRSLVETFLSLLRGQSLALDGEQEFESVKDIPSFQRRWVVPLLALVVPSLHDTLLAHDLLFTLLRLFGACTRLADILLDSGLLSVLCNAATVLSAMDISTLPRSDGGLLLGDIQQFLLAATLHACTSAGSHYFRLLDDLLAMLGHFQTSQHARTQALAAALQFKVLHASINFIHSVVTARGRSITSSFSLPSKPHHALQQKRRSIAGTLPMWDSIIPRQPRQHLPSHASPVTPTSLQLGSSSAPFARAGFAVPTSPGGRHLASGQDNVLIAQLRSAASEEFTRLVQRRLSHDGVVCAREAELTQRLQRVSVMAVNRLLFHDTSYDAVDIGDLPAAPVFVWPQTREQPSDDAVHETTSPRVLLQEGVFHLMVEGLKTAVEGARGLAPCQQWCRLLSSCRETFRVQFARLLLHILSPLRPFSERLLGLSLLLEPSCKEILREVLTTPLQPGPKLAVSAFELLWEKSGQLSRQEQKSVELLLTLLKQAGTKIPGSCPAWPETLETLHMEVENWNKEEAVNRESWWRRMVTTQQELLGRIEARGRIISRAAAQVTQRVASRQGVERKRVMEHLREACKADLGTQHSWQALFCQLTHERAVWFDPVACPMSWQLDPTEGPSRERRRLQRCRLHVPNKYLLKDHRQSDDISQPLLSYLFEDKSHFSGASAVKDRATSEPTKFTRHCISIVPSRETPGELLLGEKGMYFVEDNAGDSAEGLGCTGDAEPLSSSWAYEDIKEVHLRWFQLRDNALEIFLINGRTLLLTFESTKVRDQVHQSVLSTELPNLLEYRNLHALTQLWSSGQITNFEYLTHLNKHAGRSFNDLMQYPVMPFVLSDYTSEMLNLTDLQVYRNLAKPIAVQSKEKEDRYVHNYKWLEEEFQKGGREDDPMPPVQPYHYGSHYSNSGTTLHFLVRLPPFTKMFLAYQDQSFDIPDRTFHSMYTTWRLSSYESSTDVKELIPEFFYMPEFLLNREGFDFGIRQNGSPVHHVSLPPWARSDPRLFVLIHRQALESDHMSLTLCHWIDLVFGHKQKGRAAVQAINVFHPATYFGMDVSAVEDPVQQRALETMIRTYGQTPRQLFTVPHPSRCLARSPSEMEATSAMGIFVQFAFRESHEVARDITVPSPLPWIRGLKWGEYVGSPSCPDPVVCFSQAHPGQSFGCLLPLPTRAICGLAQNFCLLMTYSKEQGVVDIIDISIIPFTLNVQYPQRGFLISGVRTMHSTDIQWSAILSWGYVDNSLRLKSKQTGPALSVVQCDAADEVCCCAWTPDSRQLYTGNRAGVLTVYGTHFSSSVPLELELECKVCFYGHKGGIAALHVCKPFSILVSASQDGTCILWDLNRLCYVQSLTDHKSPVNAISVSDTTGDIASACHSVGGGSDLRLWTVNGDLIGHMHSPEAVCSLAFSNQPEGVSVNVIAGGLENGVVRLWSTWDLKAIREIMYPKCSLSITSLTFSVDGLYLFTADEEGKVMSWCRRDHIRNKPPLFYSFLSGFAE